MATGLGIASQVVAMVHGIVRDAIAKIVGSAISWAAEAVFSVGLATPWIIEQVSTRVASLAASIGTKVTEAIKAIKELSGLLRKLKPLLEEAAALFRKVLNGTHEGIRSGSSATEGAGKHVVASQYATLIDDRVTDLPTAPLSPELVATFTDGQYRTVQTTQDVTLYRAYGGEAHIDGAFATTESAGNRLNAKLTSALLPQWKNTREWEATINVPVGSILNIGKVAPQTLISGATLPGGADQILLPHGWDSSWVTSTSKLPPAIKGLIP